MAVPVVTLVIASTFGYLTRLQANDALVEVQRTYRVVQAVEDVQLALSDAEAGMRGYLLTGQDDFLGPYEGAVSRIPSSFRTLASLVEGDAADEEEVRTIETLSVDELTLLARLKPYAPISTQQARHTVTQLLREGNGIAARSRNLLASMQGHAETLLAIRQVHLAAVRLLSFRVQIIALPLGAFAGLLLVVFFVASLVRRIRQVEHNALLLAQGMPMPAAPTGKDEIGRLGRAIVETGGF
jgi:CHASE3 domain sensor protein